MVDTLFKILPEKIEDFLLEIIYDGPSFQGTMEIHKLGEEILGLEYCLKKIIQTLRTNGAIEMKDDEYFLVVEAPKAGSFKKRIKIISNDIEKRPATTAAVVAIFIGIITVIPLYGGEKIKDMSPELMKELGNQTKIALLKDKDFIANISKTIYPLEENDTVVFNSPTTQTPAMCIDYSKKSEFLKLIKGPGVGETLQEGVVTGKIIKIDLDATKHQIDFKENGEGARIDCFLNGKLDVSDYVNLLGKWVEISGNIKKQGDQITSIEIFEMTEVEPPLKEATQKEIQ